MPIILSFDVSSVSTGFMLIKNGKIDKDAYGLIVPHKKLSYGAKLLYFQNEMSRLIDVYKPDTICIEDIFKGRNMITFKSLAMFRGVAIKTVYEKIGKDPLSLMAVEARAFLGLSSNKEDAFKEAVKKYGLKKFKFEKDNDILDAIILGMAVSKMLEQGIDEKSLQGIGRRKKRKSKRNKKRI